MNATPYLGGVAIVVATVAAWAIVTPSPDPRVLTLIVTGIIVAMLGLADDVRPARVSVRLLVEFLAAGAVVASGARVGIIGAVPGIGDWPDKIFTVLWIVLMTNSYNLLDNSDGAAGCIAVMTTAAMAVLPSGTGWTSIAVFELAISASCAGFLVHNWPPARIFMGDAGSLFLGFAISGSAVVIFGLHNGSPQSVSWTVRAASLLLLTFVATVDTLTVIVSRFRAGRPLMRGSTDHASHRLRALGLRTAQATILLSAVAGISCALILPVSLGILPGPVTLVAVLTTGSILVMIAQRVRVYAAQEIKLTYQSPPPVSRVGRTGDGADRLRERARRGARDGHAETISAGYDPPFCCCFRSGAPWSSSPARPPAGRACSHSHRSIRNSARSSCSPYSARCR
jgi:UDP-GlcNAc:undecaprenyl-phosphate/decaprenyl-phosphate GlcNAc-1-phosphate transferase